MRTGSCVTAIVEYKGKLQLGEVMPNAIQLMSKAAQDAGLTVNGTVKEMMALQQTGGLISSKVLPFFAKRMSEAAKANGGLENAMKSNRVAMNQMVTAAQMAADTMFKSGWSEGLTELFKATGDMLMENETLFISMGKVAGKVFKGIAWFVKNILNPTFSALGSILNSLNDVFGETSVTFGLAGIAMLAMIKSLTGAFSLLGLAINASLWPVVGTLAAIASGLMLIEELAELITPTGKKTFIGEVLGIDPEKAKEEGGVLGKDAGGVISDMMSGFLSGGAYNAIGAGIYSGANLLSGKTPNTSVAQSGSYGTQPVVVHNNNTLVVDGEVIATSVSKSEALQQQIAQSHFSSNY